MSNTSPNGKSVSDNANAATSIDRRTVLKAGAATAATAFFAPPFIRKSHGQAKKRVFISVDMEGTTGLERLEEIFRGLPGYDYFRQLMAGDTNAAIKGAMEAGAWRAGPRPSSQIRRPTALDTWSAGRLFP